jgi:hypothetical protein
LLEREIAQHFERNEWTWNLKGGRVVVPNETDVLDALDKAAEVLYGESVGTQLEVGRLIVTKTHAGYDVFVYFGSYK